MPAFPHTQVPNNYIFYLKKSLTHISTSLSHVDSRLSPIICMEFGQLPGW